MKRCASDTLRASATRKQITTCRPCTREDQYQVFVRKESFKFNAAHFIAFKGFRERLHGHNYTAAVRLEGSRISDDGYVLDFGKIKQIMKQLCKSMNEHFLLPMQSDVLDIAITSGSVTVKCEDGAMFSFPEGDCLKLPIIHSSVEELARYFVGEVIQRVGRDVLLKRGIYMIEITVSEAPGQDAIIRRHLHDCRESTLVETHGKVCGSCQAARLST